jgi:hypothetical protein
VPLADRNAPAGVARRSALTGLRRGDAVRFGRQHVRDGVGTINTEKSGFIVTVTLPILPVLADTLAAGPCGDLTFIAGERGQPLTKESFGNLFRAACRAAPDVDAEQSTRPERARVVAWFVKKRRFAAIKHDNDVMTDIDVWRQQS